MSEPVYVASNAGTKRVYHTDKHCTHLKDKRREWNKEDAEKMDYTLCRFCEDDMEYDFSDRDKSLRQKINDGEIDVPGQKYHCNNCETEKVLPIRPSDAERSINTGCNTCKRVTRHTKL